MIYFNKVNLFKKGFNIMTLPIKMIVRMLEFQINKDKDLWIKYKDDLNLTETIIDENIKVKVLYNKDSKFEFIVYTNKKIYTNLVSENDTNHINNIPKKVSRVISKHIWDIRKRDYCNWLKLNNETKIKQALEQLIDFGRYTDIFKSYDKNVEWCTANIGNIKIVVQLDDECEYEIVIYYNDNKFILNRKYQWNNDYSLPLEEMKKAIPTELYDELSFKLKDIIAMLLMRIGLNYFCF